MIKFLNKSKPLSAVLKREYSSSAIFQISENDLVENFVTDHLEKGKVKVWSMGDDCPRTGKQSLKAKKMLEKLGIAYEETIVSEHP